MRTRRYVLRYLPLLLLILLLIPIHNILNTRNQIIVAGNTDQLPVISSPFSPGSALYGVAMPSSQDVWAVGGTFQLVTEPHDIRVFPVSGLIMHYQNGSWLASGPPLKSPLLSISMSSPQDGWAVGYAGQLAHYNGHSWEALNVGANDILCSVVMLSANEGWAIGFGGLILHFQHQQWQEVPSPTTADLLSLKMVSAQEGWIVGDNGTILHYLDGKWQMFNSPIHYTLNDVSMLSANEGWAVGDNGIILHYRDGVWSLVQMFPPGQTSPLLNISMTSAQSGWIVGKQVMLAYQQEVWQQANTSSVLQTCYALVMHDANNGWAVGSNNSIYHYQSGRGWHLVYTNN